MAKGPKKDAAAAAAPEPAKPPAEEKVDKVQEVLDEIKKKSSEIVISGLFAKPVADSAEAIRDKLDEVVGIDGWEVDFSTFASESIKCTLRVCIAGEWITKAGIGSPNEGTSMGPTKLRNALDNSFRAAARMYGIGPAKTPTTNEPAAAAKGDTTAKPGSNGTTTPAKPAANAADVKKEQGKKVDELKKFWSVKLTECQNPDDLNTLMRGTEIKAVPDFAKRPVFEHIRAEAKTIGWEYDTKALIFFQPVAEDEQDPVPDAIPF